MLVRRLQEFIQVVSLNEASLNFADLTFLNFLKTNFSSLEPSQALSNYEITLIESAFIQRWNHIVNNIKDDYTILPFAPSNEWIALAKSLGKELRKPFLTILISGAELARDFDLNEIEDLNNIYLGHDDKTICSVTSLLHKLRQSVNTLVKDGKFDNHPSLTIKELYRLCSKEHANKEELSFKNYFIDEILPVWHSDCVKIELTSALCEVIHTYFDCEEAQDFAKFKIAFKNFCNYLNTFAPEDINALYSIYIEYEQNKVYLAEILIDCFANPELEDLAKKLNIVLDKIYSTHSPSFLKNKLFERPIQTKHYFEFHNLQELLSALSLTILPAFSSKASVFKHKFLSQNTFNSTQLEELSDLLSMNWQKIIYNSDNLLLQEDKSGLTIWHCLVRQFAPTWKATGQLPRQLLPDLLTVIEAYFQSIELDNKSQLKRAIIDFINALKFSNLEDVNYLYSVLFKVRGKQFYLLELLIELLQPTTNLTPKLKAVAQWIYELDHSLIGKQNQLASVYQTLQAGAYYKLSKLESLVNALSTESLSIVLKEKITKLKQSIRAKEKINQKLIMEIVEIFSLRWQEISDKRLDYTRLVDGANKSWISLAQYLEGAGLINFLNPPIYYKLLIPTLTHHLDFVTEEKLTVYPLTYYIVSEQGDELIFLPNCINNFKYRKTFYNCNHFKPFTSLEKERIKQSLPHFVNCFNEAEEEKHEVPASRKTVLEVKKLVEGTLYPEGLYLGNNITESQLDCAENSYAEFLVYLNSLPEEERLHLLNQTIFFEGRKITFLEVLEQVLDKGECLVVYAQYFLKFLIDYDPFVRFPVEWEHKVRIDPLRLQSAQKVYSDYNYISSEEAIKRILILCVSVMTHNFKYLPLTGSSLSLWDRSNTITKTGKDIMSLIKRAIVTGNFTQARFIYASLIEAIIKPASINDGFRVTFMRYTDTMDWLNKIIDETLFKQNTITCFEPDTLLMVLWSYNNRSSRVGLQIESFLEEIILTQLQEQNDYLKWIRINIKFSEFLKEIPKEDSDEILSQLREKVEPIPPSTLLQTIRDFMIHRMAWQVARTSKNFGIFKDSSINTIFYQDLAKRFHQELDAFNFQGQAWYELPTILEKIARRVLPNFEMTSLPRYFSKLATNIPFLETSQDEEEMYLNSSVMPTVL
ncbi:Uncharacterised protein [Legionella busanensis]|uniref:Uncharacterized protein n=1 Tax=Legionella busanensis TaxID=190655 RepID=A0A378JPI0_9GAMM|nr:hypothetical protein [Legionella busanensis]STX52588.1 Uncharacterised protein [Legionella busanensis]